MDDPRDNPWNNPWVQDGAAMMDDMLDPQKMMEEAAALDDMELEFGDFDRFAGMEAAEQAEKEQAAAAAAPDEAPAAAAAPAPPAPQAPDHPPPGAASTYASPSFLQPARPPLHTVAHLPTCRRPPPPGNAPLPPTIPPPRLPFRPRRPCRS